MKGNVRGNINNRVKMMVKSSIGVRRVCLHRCNNIYIHIISCDFNLNEASIYPGGSFIQFERS